MICAKLLLRILDHHSRCLSLADANTVHIFCVIIAMEKEITLCSDRETQEEENNND